MTGDEYRYRVEFAEETDPEFAKLGEAARVMILRAVLKKLRRDPQAYGDPLRGDLAGYYKLRVGQYRVAFYVEENRVLVLVLAVGKRAAGDRENFYSRISREELDRRRGGVRKRLEQQQKTLSPQENDP